MTRRHNHDTVCKFILSMWITATGLGITYAWVRAYWVAGVLLGICLACFVAWVWRHTPPEVYDPKVDTSWDRDWR